MNNEFVRDFYVRWGDLDFNGHMRNTAFLDVAADVRMMFFSENGFAMSRLSELRLGPAILRDELEYRKEMHLLQKFRVNLLACGYSQNFDRFRYRNEFYREDGKLTATVTSLGAWFSLATRAITPPPDDLREILLKVQRADGYAEI